MPDLAAVRLAVGTCTVLPAGAVRVDGAVARRAMIIAPLAVLPIAAAAALAGWAARQVGAGPLLSGLLVVGAMALGTRAVHLDGLADTVDGLGSGRSAEGALAVMRRGDVGPFGVVALIVVVGVQAAALGALTGTWTGAGAVLIVLCSARAGLGIVCAAGVPAARRDGLGAAVAGTVPRPAAGLSWLLVAGALAGAGWLAGGPWWLGPTTAGLAGLTVVLLVRRCVRRLGGVTGDVMGAAVELGVTVMAAGISLS
jgi:adenosylcobinamide-GDP ribazoletransferase